MQTGTVIYNRNRGIGIVVGIKGSEFMVLFMGEDNPETIEGSELFAADPDILDALMNLPISGCSMTEMMTARKMVDSKRVKNIAYNRQNGELLARTVNNNGSINSVVIMVKDGEWANNCSCSDRKMCVHSCAAILRLRSAIEELETRTGLKAIPRRKSYGNKNIAVYMEKLASEYDRDFIYEPWRLMPVLLAWQESKDYSDKSLSEILNEVVKANRIAGTNVPSIIDFFLMNDEIRGCFEDELSDGEVYVEQVLRSKLSQVMRKEDNRAIALSNSYAGAKRRNSTDYSEEMLYYLANKRYMDCVRCYVAAGRNLASGSGQRDGVIGYIKDNCSFTSDQDAELKELILQLPGRNEANCLIRLVSEKTEKEIRTSKDFAGDITYDVIDSIAPENILDFAARMSCSDIIHAADSEPLTADGIKLKTQLLEVAAAKHTDYSQGLEIVRRAESLPSGKLLAEYLSLRYIETRLYLKDGFNKTDMLSRKVIFDALNRYFDTRYNTHQSPEFGATFEYSVLSLLGNEVFSAQDNGTGMQIQRCWLGPAIGQHLTELLPLYMSERYGEEIELKKAEAAQLRAEAKMEKYKKKLNMAFKSAGEKADEKEIVLSQDAKADVQLQFEDSEDRRTLRVKAGTDKMYLMPIVQFIRAFNDAVTVEYGKKLVLTHELSNFTEEAAEIVKVLLVSNIGKSHNAASKEEVVSDRLTELLLQKSVGRIVFWNNEPYKVDNSDCKVWVKLDENYTLTLLADGDIVEYYSEVGDTAVIITEGSKLLRITPLPSRQRKLWSLAHFLKEEDISPSINAFKDEIYSRFSQDIEIPESLKENFRLSGLTIDSFFDLADNVLFYTEKLNIEGETHKPSGLKRKTDKDKYARYCRYMENLGFEDRKLTSDQKILSFLRADLSALKEMGEVYLSDSLSRKKLVSFMPGKIIVNSESTIMNAFLDTSEYSDEELEQILKAIKRKKLFVLLKDDRIVALDKPETKDFEDAVKDLGLDQKALKEKQRISITAALKALAHEKCCETDDYLKRMAEDIKNYKTYEAELPDLNAQLRPYQTEAFKWLSVLTGYGMGGVLADDMGLGKTIEIISLIAASDAERPSLIVCPKSLVFNWKNEFSRFCPETETVEIYGSASARKKDIEAIANNVKRVYITAYDSLRNDENYYKGHSFEFMVLDEAQFIKNTDTKKSKSVKTIEASHRFALTGTPIENNVMDLWSIFDFVMPGYLEDENTFSNLYVGSDCNLERLAKKTGPFVLRRTKEDVLQDLPDKYERVISAEMTTEQRKVYDAYILKVKQLVDAGEAKAFDLLPYITRLRQICVDPSTFVEDYSGGSGKIELLGEMLTEYTEEGHKLLVFSQFVKALDIVAEILKRKGIEYLMLTGDTDSKDRIAMAEEFNSETSDKKVFLVSLKAGGTGLNLVGADTVVHLDPWWNVAAQDQATDRAYRIGQKRNVEVIKLICENTIEQRVIELQNIKKGIIDKVISDDDSSVTGVTLEDISFILR